MKANQDIRDYMADHCVTQRDLAAEVGVSQYSINKKLQTEMSQKDKEMYLNMIDSIVAERSEAVVNDAPVEETSPTESEDVSCSTRFQIGDRVKIPSKGNKVGTVTQGEKTWVYARGHAHILHDGEVGMAQAVSFAARRMFETLDKKQEKQIYFK